MQPHNRQTITIGLLAWGFLLATGEVVEAQVQDPQLKKIFMDWKLRRECLKSVRYELVGESITPKNSSVETSDETRATIVWPPEDLAKPKTCKVLFDFVNNRFRIEDESDLYHMDRKKWFHQMRISAYDGKQVMYWMPRDRNPDWSFSPGVLPDVSISKGNLRSNFGILEQVYPVFLAHGIVATSQNSVFPGQFGSELDEESFFVAGASVQDGRNCTVVRRLAEERKETSFSEYYVAPNCDNAIVRHINWYKNSTDLDWDIGYQHTSRGWFLKGFSLTHRIGVRLQKIERMKVIHFELDPEVSAQDFEISIRPGMLVETNLFEGANRYSVRPVSSHTYRVDGDGEWLEIVDGNEQPKASRRLIWWLTSLLVGTLFTGATWLLWKKSRRRGTQLKSV